MKDIVDSLVKLDNATRIALISVVVSVITLITATIFNYKTRKQYLDSLKPLLSFRLIKYNRYLYLTITNTGNTEAKNVKVTIDELGNNGDSNNKNIDELFKVSFELYPNETVQGMIGYYGQNVANNVFPFIKAKIEYNNSNKKKKIFYTRIISFTTAHESKIYAEVDLDTYGIVDNLNSIAHSNNRVANYIEGRTLFVMDRLNVFPRNSLYKDMKDAINNVERKEEVEEQLEERTNDIVQSKKNI